MKYAWLYIPGLVMLIMPVMYALFKLKKENDSKHVRELSIKAQQVYRVLEMTTPDAVLRFMEEYAYLYQLAEPELTPDQREAYNLDVRELSEHLSDLETARWWKQASPHLQSFVDCYDLLKTQGCRPEEAQAIKAKCIREWQAYYRVDLSKYHTTIYPKRVFREQLGDDYDECMDEHYALERRLDKYIRQMQA